MGTVDQTKIMLWKACCKPTDFKMTCYDYSAKNTVEGLKCDQKLAFLTADEQDFDYAEKCCAKLDPVPKDEDLNKKLNIIIEDLKAVKEVVHKIAGQSSWASWEGKY